MSTKSEPTIGALLGSLAGETGTLVRQEMHLASTEMSQKAKKATSHLGVVTLGGALALAGFLTVIAAVVLGLEAFVPMWISAMVLGGLAAASGGALIHKGMKALRELDPVPQRTVRTLQQDAAWVKEQFR